MLQAFDKLKAFLDNETFKQSDFYVAYTSVKPILKRRAGIKRGATPKQSSPAPA
jgi:hypothetical protein